jgi:hypothetical protein
MPVKNAKVRRAAQDFMEGSIDLLTDTIDAYLIDLDSYTLATAVTGATNVTPIVITAVTHGRASGEKVSIVGVGGNDNANGAHFITVLTANTFELYSDSDRLIGVAGSGVFTSGGFVIPLSGDLNLDDIDVGARSSTVTIAVGKTTTDGVFDANDITFVAVPTGGPHEAMAIVRDSGVEATSRQLAWLTNVTGLPVTSNGGNIDVTWSALADRIMRI